MSAVILAVTVAGAMAAGVLLAYAACQAMFSVFQLHARSITAETAAAVKAAPQVLQS